MYYNNGTMKKIISFLISSIYLISMPMCVFAEYDFSDEAQAEFDRTHQGQAITYPYSGTNYTNSTDRTNYSPNPSNHSKTKGKKRNNNLLYDEETQQAIEQNNNQIQNDIKLRQYPSNDKLYGSIVHVPSGTTFDVTFDSGISSGSTAKNDLLTVRLTEDFVYNGTLIAPAGSLVYGTTTDAVNAGYAYGSGAIQLNFNRIMTPEGTMINVSTRTIVLKAKNERAAKMSRDILVGTLGSLLVGAAFTALGGGNNWGRNLAIYGGIGAIGGGIHGAMQRGEELQIPDGTTIKVTLTDNLTASPYVFAQ